jgi:phage replication-related protein YjqB (UPF0714/DUF867 family)
MEDKYDKFARLTAEETEGVDYRVLCADRRSRALVLAPHAGAIEPGTSEIAQAVAGKELSFYLFEGIKPSGNRALHVTSAHFDEPRALKALETCEKAIAIHGEGSDKEIAYVGGRDGEMRSRVEHCLEMAGFVTRTHLGPGMQGTSPDNVCNRGRAGAGVQLELSRGLRKSFFRSLDRDGRRHPTETFFRFVQAIREGMGCADGAARRGPGPGARPSGVRGVPEI